MNTGSVLSDYFACCCEAQHEDEWIDQDLERLGSEVLQGQLDQAAESCQRLLARLEVHFAFEELVMTRIAFPWAYGHYADHVDLLVGIARLLQELRGFASDPQDEERGQRLWQHLCDVEHNLHIHAMRRDRLLRQYVARTMGMIRPSANR